MAGAPLDLIDKEMWQESYNQLSDAIKTGFGEVEWGKPDWMLNQNLKYNAATFAAFKQHAESKEIQKLLLTDGTDGLPSVSSWKAFRDQALLISEKYNKRWLQTEYNHAVQSSRMARKWQDAVGDSDLYPNLKYVTAGDERVRHSHKDLNGAIYPINDPFWNTYYPPNGWGCRCTVRPTDQPTKQAAGLPEMPDMFKTNPGKTGNMFPEQNPYAAKATPAEKKEIEKFVKENVFVPAKTVEEAKEFAKNNLGIKNDNRNLSVQALNSINEALFDLHKDFDFKFYLTDLKMQKGGKSCARANNGYIEFGSKYFEATDPTVLKAYKRSKDLGWWPKVDDAIDTRKVLVTHEFGHCLTLNKAANLNFKLRQPIEDIYKRYHSHMSNLRKKGVDPINDSNFVSGYSEKHVTEFVSESFSQVRLSDNPSPYAKEVYEIIKKEYGRK